MVLSELQNQFQTAPKLQLAYALARFGDPQVDFLVERIASASPDEVNNIIAALRSAREEAVVALKAAAVKTPDDKRGWRHKARLAVVALYLNNDEVAKDMCRRRKDLTQRTLFVEECSQWHASLSKLATTAADTDDIPLRAALAAAVGSAGKVPPSDRKTWESLLQKWYRNEPDLAGAIPCELRLTS